MELTLGRRPEDGAVGLLDQVAALEPGVGVRRIDDGEEMQSLVEQFMAGARREVCSVLPGGPYSLEVMRQSWDEDTALLARGVTARIIYQSDAVRTPDMMRYVSDLAAVGGDLRVAPHSVRRMMIFDRRAVVVAMSEQSMDLPFMLISEPALVQSFCNQFAGIWRLAHSIGITAEDVLDFDRVQEILRALASGATDEAVSRKLGVSDRTVRRRVAAVMDLLDASSRFEAGVKAVQAGWI